MNAYIYICVKITDKYRSLKERKRSHRPINKITIAFDFVQVDSFKFQIIVFNRIDHGEFEKKISMEMCRIMKGMKTEHSERPITSIGFHTDRLYENDRLTNVTKFVKEKRQN